MASRPLKRLVRLHFDRASEDYERWTAVQAHMGEEVLRLVSSCQRTAPARILELGCGTGRLTLALRRAFPEAEITAVDFAPRMLAIVRRQAGADPRLRLVEADAEAAATVFGHEPPFAAIVSNATVQWFDDPPTALSRGAALLAPGGVLAFSTFGAGNFPELRAAFLAAAAVCGVPAGHHLLELPATADWEAALRGLSGHSEVREQAWPEVYAGPEDFLETVRQAGASLGDPTALPLKRRLYHAMLEAYRQRFANPATGGVTATWQLLFGLYVAPAHEAACAATRRDATAAASPRVRGCAE